MKPSVSRITGVIRSRAILLAIKAISKQSLGLLAATTTSGHSPLRPQSACMRSDCSVFVGRPVEGPPRCTSTITSGNSVITANPSASLFSERPGPEVVVMAKLPAKAAPIEVQIPAISSSACRVLTPKSLRFASSTRMSVAGVMGYEPQNKGRPDFSAAAIKPHAVAVFPLMLR